LPWAILIKLVFEVDPLICPKCGGEMKIISFIEKRQTDVIEKILKHCHLWKVRPPPKNIEPETFTHEFQYDYTLFDDIKTFDEVYA
jgi:hypothetical protein